ncbi:hypothetical protein HN385_00545 [archaeon]|nr:hypothetical protein [archaeon]MBT3451588.1 hypothetical protein [archaeon]MBT6869608.1 hypothetical protein [archaeon]MBT7192377.1 hypothetical protein [archaeon]MBT7380178.1 hypothetical protein [archaeon]
MSEIKVTLESLYDILRNEKKKEELQQLENSFHVDVVSYLRTKKALLDAHKDKDELFANNEREKLEYELRSIKRILKEIYEKREKKIIDIALNKSRTRSDIIETNMMLREEKEFYDRIVKLFDMFRTGVLLKLFQGELPFLVTDHTIDRDISSSKTEIYLEDKPKKDNFKKFENVDGIAIEPNLDEDTEEHKVQEPSTESEEDNLDFESENQLDEKSESEEDLETEQYGEDEENKEAEISKSTQSDEPDKPKQKMTKVKFLHPVPRFIWKDMKEYGPFEKEEIAEVFPEIANLLIRKGRAEED